MGNCFDVRHVDACGYGKEKTLCFFRTYLIDSVSPTVQSVTSRVVLATNLMDPHPILTFSSGKIV